jgi:nickel transport protein
MITKQLTQLLLSFAILPIMIQPAFAHSMYFGNRGDNIPLLFGHPEEGEDSVIPYTPSTVKQLTGFDVTGATIPVEINNLPGGISVVPNKDLAALTAFVDRGFYVVTSDNEYLNIPKYEATTPYTQAFRSYNYPKSLYKWSDAIDQSLGLDFEIVPLQNPFEVASGNNLDVQVLFQGTLLKEVLVEYRGQAVPDSNNDGIFSIPWTQKGLKTIEASFSIPLANDPEIDELSYSASLSVQGVPEPGSLISLGAFAFLAFASKSKFNRTSQGVLAKK